MTKKDLKDRIKGLAFEVIRKNRDNVIPVVQYDELTKFPELKQQIIALLTSDYEYFLSSIDWVAPRPTTFRINLKNGQSFYLIYTERSWIAQVNGKKYYLLNLPEEQRAAESIARLLRISAEVEKDEVEGGGDDFGGDDFGGDETDTTEEPTDEA